MKITKGKNVQTWCKLVLIVTAELKFVLIYDGTVNGIIFVHNNQYIIIYFFKSNCDFIITAFNNSHCK